MQIRILSIAYCLVVCLSASSEVTAQPSWQWQASQSGLLWCVFHNFNQVLTPELTVEIASSKQPHSTEPFKVRVLRNGQEACAFNAHPSTVLLRKDMTLYVSDFHYMRSGCLVIVFDLEHSKVKWKTALKGIGPVAHSKYQNHVNFKLENDLLVVFGKESQGRYIESLNVETGQAVSNYKLPKE